MEQRYTFDFTLLKKATMRLFFFGVGIVYVFGQQDTQYTQYMYNTNTINPAYAGSQEALTATLLYRNQWLGLEGAPEVLNFTAHSQLGRRTGAGFSFTSDKIGPSSESTINADFSYTIPIGEINQLAFGLKGGMNLLNIDYASLTIYNSDDTEFQQNIDNRLSPIAGAGVFLYNNEFYAGLSVPNVLKTTYYNDRTISNAQERPNFYFVSGYVFELSRYWLFKPALLAKAVKDAPIAVDVSANFLFNEKFTVGAGYRFGTSISFLSGFQADDHILIGYAYDYSFTNLGNYTSGSHELFIRFSLGDKRDDKLLTPRFFF